MSSIEKLWFKRAIDPRLWPLVPLTAIFWCLSAIRRWCFRIGVKKSTKVEAPVIIVGNLSVGGNGKTPLVLFLAQWLRQQGYYPGVLSRGYGGKAPYYPFTVEKDSDPAVVGDEPVLMRQHLPCPMAVDPERARGADFLLSHHKCDVIICDDGLQHYALERDIEIVVLDGERRYGNGFLLPAGPLREGTWRLNDVDFVVNNGGTLQDGEHLMLLEPGRLVNVKYPQQTRLVSDLNKPACAIAAIGNPQRFFDLLDQKQVKLSETIAFPDHHQFRLQDIPEGTVLMTEKDAVKCREFASDDWWYLPVTATLSEDFKSQLLDRIKQVRRKR